MSFITGIVVGAVAVKAWAPVDALATRLRDWGYRVIRDAANRCE